VAITAVQCGRQVFGQRLDLLLMECISPDDVIALLTRVKRSCFGKMRMRIMMWDCVVVVKPQMQRKDKMLLEVSLQLPSK